MDQTQPLLDDIRDELSTDIYYIYEDERHFLLETVAGAIAMACLIDYVKGLLSPKELGEQHHQYLKEFVERTRKNEIISIKSEMDRLENETRELTLPPLLELTEERETTAIEGLRNALEQMGMPVERAKLHAQNIAASVRSYYKS